MKHKLKIILTILLFAFAIVGCTPPQTSAEVVGIEVSQPTKLTYEKGTAFDFSSIVVEKRLDDDSKEVLLLTDFTLTGFNPHLVGEQTVTITYLEYTHTFVITVTEVARNLESFDLFLDSLFVRYLSGDAFSVNYLLLNPENFGLEHEVARLPRPSEDEFLGWMDEVSDDLDALYSFNREELSISQKLTYDILESSFLITLEYEPYFYLANSFLGSYLGYQAQLPILLAEYRFDDMTDIENYFDLIEDIPDAFETYFLFEVERSSNGYGMADFIIDKVIEQCAKMLESVSDPYLIRNFNAKVDGLSFLTESEKVSLKARNNNLIIVDFFGGYQYLKDHLSLLKGGQSNNSGLYYLEGGREYYKVLFQDATGITVEIEDAFAYLEAKADQYYVEYSALASNNSIVQEYFAMRFSLLSAPNMVDYHKQMLTDKFPALSNDITYQIKYVDASMQDNFSPAAYFLSPIDAITNEVMYLNPKYTNDSNYIFTTLAHEGYPGHLYQHVYFKSETDAPYIRHLLSFSGYDEGWATYVEHRSVEYANGTPSAKNLYLAEKRVNMAVTAIIDIGIHYYGWTTTEIGSYLNTRYGFGATGYDAMFEQLVEIPTNVQEYYYTYFTLLDMYHETKATLGASFNEIEYHKVLLDTGPAPFVILKQQLDQYISSKLTS